MRYGGKRRGPEFSACWCDDLSQKEKGRGVRQFAALDVSTAIHHQRLTCAW
jgi:hypothetical protein